MTLEHKAVKGLKTAVAHLAMIAAIAGACAGAVTAVLAPIAPIAVAKDAPARSQDPAAPPPTSRPVIATAWLTGTVSAVDVSARTVDLLTGVGYALRIRRVQLPPALEIEARRAESTAPALTPGSIVRIGYRQTASGTVATTVELLHAPPRAEAR